MKKKYIVGIGLILITFLGCWWLWQELTWEGERFLGVLKHPCNKEYSIKIYHQSEFDRLQLLEFSITNNDSTIYEQRTFEYTNRTRESLSSFEINCYKNVLYITWVNENVPLIMFDTKSNKLYHLNNENDNKYRKELFDVIKIGNIELQIE